MKHPKFKPLFDKTYRGIWISVCLLMAVCTLTSVWEPTALFIFIPTDLFAFYFLVSPLFGYVELREETVFMFNSEISPFADFFSQQLPFWFIL